MKHLILTALLAFSAIGFCDSLPSEITPKQPTDSSLTNPLSPVGMYVVKLPSASGMGRVIILHIFKNGNALRSNIYIGRPHGDYVEEGKWQQNADTLKLTLTGYTSRYGKEKISKTLLFKIVQNGLVTIKYDETPFGRKQIRFTKVPESF